MIVIPSSINDIRLYSNELIIYYRRDYILDLSKVKPNYGTLHKEKFVERFIYLFAYSILTKGEAT